MKGTAKKVNMCEAEISLGDYVRVRYTKGRSFKGGIISGKIVELWDNNYPQARVESGWCFHDQDKLLTHNKQGAQHGRPRHTDNGK